MTNANNTATLSPYSQAGRLAALYRAEAHRLDGGVLSPRSQPLMQVAELVKEFSQGRYLDEWAPLVCTALLDQILTPGVEPRAAVMSSSALRILADFVAGEHR